MRTFARPRFWVSLDGNFWCGGRTSVDGVSPGRSP